MKTKVMKQVATVLLLIATTSVWAQREDWADFKHYAADNNRLQDSIRQSGWQPEAVFMGNSITEGWGKTHPDFFAKHGFVCRGISGQTTYQMLLRFNDDVLALKPKVVIILGGTNDIAENNHEYVISRTLSNIRSMAELARLHGVAVVLCSVLPSSQYWWRKELTGIQPRIVQLNDSIRAYAESQHFPYVDYYAPMVYGPDRSLNPAYADDGVHPNSAGYDLMEPLVMKAVIDAFTYKRE